ncbi:von Willebrand factor D and EGF domain-containing protein-like [Ruditapes philippinarum]|uniref:von Willebrand factor D and EGF domain-containing protein-like n=1 Tax=Ruditapes philippinarum TaxID=129788 RepID=UPI00295C2DD8|nr:von Willebrand factor D and EGF domain-containing protein-like [Ruditapes philippinarum]
MPGNPIEYTTAHTLLDCSTPGLELPAEYLNNSAKLVKIDFSITESGWYDSMYDGQNYTIPLLKDIDAISAVCYGDGGFGLYSQDEQYLDIGDVAVGIRVCEFSKYIYYYHKTARILSYICNQHVYVRSCNGKIQLDLTQDFYYRGNKCLIRADVVKVIPEVRHKVKSVDDGVKNYNQYDPFLQFKCSFKMLENHIYTVKWYLNGHYVIEKGPSRNASVLAVTEDELGVNNLNYKVKCVVSVHSKKRSDPVETTSDDFFAGFKIIDPKISLSKSGNEIITVEQTVPIGCAYNDTSSPTCEDTVSVVDKIFEQNICSDGVFATNAISPGTRFYSIKTLKQDETWDGMTTFPFKLETVDKTYDDKDTYDLFITHSGTNAKSSGDTEDAKVRVTNLEYSKNKMCYSHVDPHMRTGNGRSYEQQMEGDYILYRNTFFDKNEILVLERARYCSGNSGPVCACAIIVRAGADAFMINRCIGKQSEVKFIQCCDGGIIDVLKISDSKYEIYTPIGTKISIHLLDGWANGRNMNVDIYLISKDEDHTDGLCGKYDKNDTNDFLLRENFPHKQETVKNNDGHRFSDSWR